LVAEWESGQPKVLEPEKCDGWLWYNINNLPEPIFEMCKISIQSYKENKNYFDF